MPRRPASLLSLLSLLAAVLSVVLVPAKAEAAVSTDITDPIGANDWSCKPSAAHPSPVVLVHGTFGDKRSLLDRLSMTLKARGYCVFSLDYGARATQPIEDSAAELSAFVDKVLGATGAAKVSLVGHSQGGMMPRYYIKFLGGDTKVDDLVGLAPSNHGTSTPMALFPGLDYLCPACAEQRTGSAFLTNLNAGDESPGPVSYTDVVTKYDEVVTPYTSGYLAPDSGVTNVTLQQTCPTDLTDHLNIPQDGPAIRWALDALGRHGPADPAYRPSCLP